MRFWNRILETTLIMRIVAGIVLIGILVLHRSPTYAAPMRQDDPAELCAEGVELFFVNKPTEALPLLEAGFDGHTVATFNSPEEFGNCAMLLGFIRDEIGDNEGALAAYTVALAMFRESGNRTSESITLNNIGLIYLNQGRYQTALENYQEALAVTREVNNYVGQGAILTGIGAVYHAQGRYHAALESYQEALAVTREVGDRAGESVALNGIGATFDDQGRYQAALENYQRALAIRREIGDRIGEGVTLNGIGLIFYKQGRSEDALDAFQQALAITRGAGNRAGEGITLSNIGLVYENQGRYAEALESHRQALAIHREVGNRAGEGATLINIGKIYSSQERYTAALESYQRALAIRREIGDRTGESTALNNIGAVYQYQKHYIEALDSYQQALGIRREIGNRVGEGITLSNIGGVYEDQRQYHKALAHYVQAITVLEGVRAIAGSEEGRTGFISQYAPTFTRAVLLLHQQEQNEQAFFTSERGRARSFLDSLSTGYVQLADNATQELLDREQETYATRQAVQDALARARTTDPPNPALIADLEQQLETAEQEYTAAMDAIAARSDELSTLIPGRTSGVLTVAEIQQHLDPATTLVSYFVAEERTLAFVLTSDTFSIVELEVSQADLLAQVQALRAFSDLAESYPASAMHLYTWLITPLREQHLLTTPHLTIVPHGVLHYLPFAALTDGERFLVDDYTLSFLPTASSLPHIAKNTGRDLTTPLVLGNPATPPNADLTSLTAAAREAQVVAEQYNATPLLGADATEAAVREQAAKAGIVHLAAHGTFNPVTPLVSTLYLAPDDQHDGYLNVSEIYGLDLRQADLVVLSACETQVNELTAGNIVSAGDDLVGMTRAFFFAGTPSVIATLWSVNDDASALLMERFYTHLRDGKGKAAALRQAQMDVREQYPNPYYWAGYVLSGDPGAVDTTLLPWVLILSGAAVLVVLALTGMFVLRRWRR